MTKKIRKKKYILYQKLVILIICFVILLRIFTLILSRYESTSNSTANVDIAFYLLKEDYQKMTLNLDSLFPQDEEYVYTFSIGNQEGTKTAETNIEYDLSIRTTTNLPITYELYMNEKHTDNGAKNIIKSNSIKQDEDGTYFRNITTDKVTLDYNQPTTNVYELVVKFPSTYNTTNYQDILEVFEIIVDGKQITN